MPAVIKLIHALRQSFQNRAAYISVTSQQETLGHVETEVTLSSKENARSVKEKALVDTGATLTVLPRRVADELLVKADARAKVLTAAGPLEVELAEVLIEIAGRRATARVTISDIIDRVLVGVTTLEILGLAVDPQTGSVREGQYLLYPT